MWACSPTSSSAPPPSAASTAAAASPSSSPSPNFESSWPVWTWLCVSAFTPGVTRIRIRWRRPAAAQIASRRAISASESQITWPTCDSTASRSSASLLLLPCMWIRAGSKPARSAIVSSPPEATSIDSPSASTKAQIAVIGAALLA